MLLQMYQRTVYVCACVGVCERVFVYAPWPCWNLAPRGVITEEVFWPFSLISVNMERNRGTSVSMTTHTHTKHTHTHTHTHTQILCARQKSRHVRGTEAEAMALVWRYVVRFFCHKSISAPASLYTYTLCVCVCFSRSTASGRSLTQSFNSNCRLFVWVRPYKHTIRLALCTEDYSWLWPQFSSGLLPGSLEVPAGKPQAYQNPGRSEPQRTAQPPQWNSSLLQPGSPHSKP